MSSAETDSRFAIVIHGGAGVINTHDEAKIETAKEGLRSSLRAGLAVLKAGGSAAEAVEAAVLSMEDHPSFNAGKGSVYTSAGTHELEASIMCSDLRCGAVCLLKHVKNPISLARHVMEHTPHIWLAGQPAEEFAKAQGLEMVDNHYFDTPDRYQQLLRYQEMEAATGVHSFKRADEIVQHTQTVGAVALDKEGRLAAATSTGGRTNKWEGRIGDTPMNGAGNYASSVCAVSGTGIGEEFMRHVIGHDVAARMQYGGVSLQEAARQVVEEVLRPGDGGLIAVDSSGTMVMPFNSDGMYRGQADSTGLFQVAVFKEQPSA